MMQSAQGDDADQSAGAGIYQEMANQQVNDRAVDGGGLGPRRRALLAA